MPSDRCYICAESNPNVLQQHHLIPQGIEKDHSKSNLVSLCANCHSAIENLYDSHFYKRLWEAFERIDGKPNMLKEGYRPPTGLKYNDRNELVPNEDFGDAMKAIRLRHQGHVLREIQEETGIPRDTVLRIYETRRRYLPHAESELDETDGDATLDEWLTQEEVTADD